MFLKQPRIRRFEYSPRFYKPESEEDDDNKIRFKRITERKPVPRRSFWGMLIMIIVLIFLIRYFSSVFKTEKEEFKFEDLKIEAIE